MENNKEVNKLFVYPIVIGAAVGSFIGLIAGVAFDILPFIAIFTGVGASLDVAIGAVLAESKSTKKK